LCRKATYHIGYTFVNQKVAQTYDRIKVTQSTIESNTWNKRFCLIPKETREIALILIERASVQHVFEQCMF
jgi:hypothetical protein